MMIDPKEVLEICGKAKLPWNRAGNSVREHTFLTSDQGYACSVTIKQIGPAILHEWMEEQRLINSDFILAAGTALPELAQRVIELEEENALLSGTINRIMAYAKDPKTIPMEDRLRAVADAAEELFEVANLRGDNELPHPTDDPKLWTARAQIAWDELQHALTAAGYGGEE